MPIKSKEKENTETGYRVPDLPAGQIHRAEETIRGSRFIVSIGHVDSPEAAKAFVESIRQEHAHATHNCWAFEAGAPETTARIGASDDGEPKGTAGRPMLTVLLHCGVGEIAAVVTRYFGGTLLGTGGLVRAYQGLVKLGLETLPVRIKMPSTQMEFSFEHRFAGRVVNLVEKLGLRILSKRFESNVTICVEIPQGREEEIVKRVSETCSGAFCFSRCE